MIGQNLSPLREEATRQPAATARERPDRRARTWRGAASLVRGDQRMNEMDAV